MEYLWESFRGWFSRIHNSRLSWYPTWRVPDLIHFSGSLTCKFAIFCGQESTFETSVRGVIFSQQLRVHFIPTNCHRAMRADKWMQITDWRRKPEKMCLLLHDIILKGKCFVLLHKDRDNFFPNSIAKYEMPRSKQFVKWKITSFVLIIRS